MHDTVCGVSGSRHAGAHLIEGADEVKLFGEPVEVKAKITQLPGLNGHADKGGLIRVD